MTVEAQSVEMTDVSDENIDVGIDAETIDSPSDDDVSFEQWKEEEAQKQENPDGSEEPKDETESEPKEGKEENDENSQSRIVKVDGEDIEIPEEKVDSLIQKGIGAERRMQEAHNIREEAREFVEFMKTSPFEALERLGLDVDDLAEQRAYDNIRYKQMSEEEREAFNLKKEVAQNKKEIQEYKQRKEQEEEQAKQDKIEQEKQARQRQYAETYKEQIPKALDLAKIPKNEENIRSMIIHMKQAVKQNPNITAYDVIDQVRKEHIQRSSSQRQQRVQDFKESNRWEEQEPKVVKGDRRKTRQEKRFSSIYDLME